MTDTIDNIVFIASDIKYDDKVVDQSIDFMIKEFESRGFLYVCHLFDKSSVTFALKLTPLLISKLKIQQDLNVFVHSSSVIEEVETARFTAK
jgi:hypothetical protein